MALNQIGLGFVFTAHDLASTAIDRIKGRFSALSKESEEVARTVKASFAQFGQGVAIAGAGLAGLVALDRAVEASGRFSYAIAEVSTLVDEATFSTAELSRISLELASAYGGSAVDQARALYQTISAGVADAARATDLLAVANELAVGGVTDTKTAVDALTNVVNAYSASGAQARDVSDAFFIAIKAGKTTAAELAATMGRVAPTAAALGVSFSDLLGAVAAVTTQGLSTAEAVTGMKAALANIIKPTADAKAEAARLGIQFDAATLRAGGLTGMLQSITGSARFNADSLSLLFGSVEALNAVTALTANNSAKYHEILGQMAARSGATRAAFEKMADTLTFQQLRFAALKQNVLIVLGQAIEPFTKAVVRLANNVLAAFLRIPAPIRDFAVRAFAAVSAILALAGAFVAAKAGIVLLGIGLKIIGVTAAGLASALLPALAVIGVLTLAIVTFTAAYRRNLGGFRDFVDRTWGKIRLAFQAVAQIFEQGGFSGAVRAELNRAENAGVKTFAIRVFHIVHRLQQLLEGVSEGIGAAMAFLRPGFEIVGAAVGLLVEQVRGLISSVSRMLGLGVGASSVWRQVGQVVGWVAGVIGFALVGAIGVVALVLQAAIAIVREVVDEITALGQAMGEVGAQIFLFFAEDVPRAFRTVAAAVRAFFQPVVDFLGAVAGSLRETLMEVVAFTGRLVAKIPARFRPAFLDSVVEAGQAAEARIAERAARAAGTAAITMVPAAGSAIAVPGLPLASIGTGARATVLPAVSEARARAAAAPLELEGAVARGLAASEPRPVHAHVSLNVDGETLARVTARAERSSRARAFSPLPAPG